MTRPEQYSYTRYLAAKRSVDDRALNRTVLDALRSACAAQHGKPQRVLELGAGIGNMLQRLHSWNVLHPSHYALVDRDHDNLAAARAQLSGFCNETNIAVEFFEAELMAFLAAQRPARYDLALANAVLDLLDVPAFLPCLWRALEPERPFWFSINFDGETVLLPELPLDEPIMALYHRSMDERVRDGRRAGDSKTGRHLLEQVPASGASIVSAGSSDWVVWPRAGAYPEDEAYFLHHIVHTIDEELCTHLALDAAAFQDWVAQRHAQIANGQLSYIAHQLDVLGLSPR